MSDLIIREDALEIVKRTGGDYATAFSEISKLPAVDAVEIVKCKDCMMFCSQSGPIAQHCFVTGNVVSDDDFCSFGERREENE